MNMIPAREVDFHPHSFGHYQLRLFRWNGQLYRGIGCDYAPFFRRLFEENVIQKMVEKGLLIDSSLQTCTVDGYAMVVRHRGIQFVSYPTEWCAAMLRDGALTMVDLALELSRHGYTLGDSHPWNLLFDIEKARPVFVDLGSVVPITEFTWPPYDEFCRFCLYPLLLMSGGEDHLARLLMWEDKGVLGSYIRKLKGISIPFLLTRYRFLLNRLESGFASRVPEFYRRWLRQVCNAPLNNSAAGEAFCATSAGSRVRSHSRFLEGVRRDVERVKVLFDGEHNESPERTAVSPIPQDNWTATQSLLHKLLTAFRPATLLDVGSHDAAWCAKLAAALGIQVVRWDRDPIAITRLYHYARDRKMPILPLVMDFSKPTAARGLADHWSIAATDRFPCDMLVAMGLLHRIVGERRLTFDQIADGLAALAKRWAVIEFVSGDDEEVRKWRVPLPWYTLANFLTAARKRFRNVQVSLQLQTRYIILCEK